MISGSNNAHYPFAMDIPTDNFIPMTEGRRIEREDLLYLDRANSNGTENTNWYIK